MINYDGITVGQVIQEALSRLGKHREEINLGYESMIDIVNMSAREVQLLTMPYKDWYYTGKLKVNHLTPIPQNYVKYIRLLVSYCEDDWIESNSNLVPSPPVVPPPTGEN
jgi:hypothetical protein